MPCSVGHVDYWDVEWWRRYIWAWSGEIYNDDIGYHLGTHCFKGINWRLKRVWQFMKSLFALASWFTFRLQSICLTSGLECEKYWDPDSVVASSSCFRSFINPSAWFTIYADLNSFNRSQDWGDDDMKTMKERLGVLLQQDSSDPASQIKIQNSSEKRLSPPADTPPGWRLLTEYSGWKPSPIGVYVQPFPGDEGVAEVWSCWSPYGYLQ